MSRSPMVSHPSSPVTRRCHIIDNRHSVQVSKKTAADFHRRRLLILCTVASQRRGGLRTWLNGRLIILLSFLLLLSFCHSKPQHIPKRLNVCTVILKPPSQVIVPGMKHLITLPG